MVFNIAARTWKKLVVNREAADYPESLELLTWSAAVSFMA